MRYQGISLSLLLSGALLSFAAWAQSDASLPPANVDYALHGNGAQKVIVVHDWLGDTRNYDPVLPYLDAQTFQFAFVDLRGYGGSMDIAGEFTASEAARDIISVADALGWVSFHIVGHSMSGMVVQKVAVTAGDRVRSIVATTPVSAGGMQVDAESYAFFRDAAREPADMAAAIDMLTGGKLSPEWTQFKVERAMARSTEAARLGYLDMFAYEDFGDEVDGIRTPVLVVLGANDIEAFQPSSIERSFGQWYPNLSVAQLSDAGHYPMQEVPVLYATVIQRFLREPTSASPEGKAAGQ